MPIVLKPGQMMSPQAHSDHLPAYQLNLLLCRRYLYAHRSETWANDDGIKELNGMEWYLKNQP